MQAEVMYRGSVISCSSKGFSATLRLILAPCRPFRGRSAAETKASGTSDIYEVCVCVCFRLYPCFSNKEKKVGLMGLGAWQGMVLIFAENVLPLTKACALSLKQYFLQRSHCCEMY